MDELGVINLLEDAFAGIRVQTCPECRGVGETLCGECETCKGDGNVVTTKAADDRLRRN